MKSRTGISLIAGAVVCLGLTVDARAATTQTVGAGTAVYRVDRAANFDALSYATNGTPLSDFHEGLLRIAVDGDSWVGDGQTDFDPFHGANGPNRTFEFPFGGSLGWVTIETTDAAPIFGLEFMYGNGWTTGNPVYPWGNHDAVLQWETWKGGALVSSGTVGGSPILEMGTVIGFSDPAGWDQLLLKCTIASAWDPNYQALAIDNLRVQLTPALGDMNCDGAVNFQDINPFVLALSDPAGYQQTYPNCDLRNGDINRDGLVDFADINPFVALLTHAAQPGPTPPAVAMPAAHTRPALSRPAPGR